MAPLRVIAALAQLGAVHLVAHIVTRAAEPRCHGITPHAAQLRAQCAAQLGDISQHAAVEHRAAAVERSGAVRRLHE